MSLVPSLAWRDSRGMRSRLVLYVSAMALGVAALVAIRSFGINLQRAVDEQAKEVFGSDLEVRSSSPFGDTRTATLDSVATETASSRVDEATFPSMARFPQTDRTRLVQVRALDGPYPLYGAVETTPVRGLEAFRAGEGALIDATLMIQMEASVGDSVQVGGETVPIVGRVDAASGQTDIAAIVGPRVYLPLAGLDSTLLGFGSRARYTTSFRFADEATTAAMAERLDPNFRVETVDESQEEIGEASEYLARFLSLVGFVALLLGGIGVASSVSVYVREKAETVATLRCLGVSSTRVLGIYAIQALAMGLVGAAVGALLGVGVQRLLPLVLSGFLPVTVANDIVPRALLEGVGIGLVAALLFALLPLAGVRRVPPLRALRADAEARGIDPLRILLGLLLIAAVAGFAYAQTQTVRGAIGFVSGTAIVFLILALAARVVRWTVRKLTPPTLPYAWRQGLANLYAPGNQTLVLLLTLGLGVFLVLALGLVQRSILGQIALPTSASGEGAPDVVLFDVQPDQRDSLIAILDDQGLPLLGEVPLVQMRIAAIDGVPKDSLLDMADSSFDGGEGGPERWAVAREYRSTYRDALVDTETLLEGTFDGTAPADTEIIPVSLETELAADLDVGLGSRITWNVGGVDIESEITSLREVDWAQVQPNFFAVFPSGPLDAAPQTRILLTRAETPARSAAIQSAAVEAFPNVSAVDVRDVLALVDRVIGRVAFVLRFMALFAVGTGLVVLAGAVRVSLQQRTREAVLLRTMGASRAQVGRILIAEYALLGLLAALTGGVLAVGGAWALARFAFEIPFQPDLAWLGLALVIVPLLTVVVGWIGSRSALRQPPLAVLRAE
ncbi:MAG: ABC transporter permease [Rubricoccaceae bacterium]